MRYCVILLLLCSAVIAKAQVPGYMGKRFSVFAQGYMFPAIFVANTRSELIYNNETYQTYNPLAFTARPQVTVEYLIKKDFAMGLSYNQFAMGTAKQLEDPNDPGSYIYNADVVRGQSIGLHFKFYRPNTLAAVAPLGMYCTGSIYYSIFNTYDDRKSTKKQLAKDLGRPVLAVEFGRQSMIAKRVLLKTGIEVGCAVTAFNLSESMDDQEEDASWLAQKSVFGYYVFNFNVGVGYLVF